MLAIPILLFTSSTVIMNAHSRCSELLLNVLYMLAEYISLLFTDLGVLTPAAVSDELIQLYV